MPHTAKTHAEFCNKLCLLCLAKGPCLLPIKRPANSTAKHDLISYIRSSWWPEYDPDNEKLPRVICMNCRFKVIQHNNPTVVNPTPLPPKLMYENIVFKPETRFNPKCGCDICLHGRFKFSKLGDPIKCKVLPQPQTGNYRTGPKGVKCSRKAGTEKRCNKCLQVIGRGLRHACTKTKKMDNLTGLVKATSTRTKSRVIAGELSKAFAEVSKESESQNSREKVISLATKGPKPLKISLDARKQPLVTHKDLINLQTSLNLSDRGILKVAEAFRVKCGRKSVQANLKSELTDRNKMLATLFEANQQSFKYKPNPKKDDDSSEIEESGVVGSDGMIDIERPMVNCLEARDIVEVVLLARHLKPEEVEIKCGIDFGQGSLKIVLLIQRFSDHHDANPSRSKYSEGLAAKYTKDGSVKKTLILGIVPRIQELHFNVKKILDMIKIDSVEFSHSADIKLLYTLVGKSCSGSMRHGCPFCNAAQPYMCQGQLYQLADLFQHFGEYVTGGSKKSQAMKFSNVINEPLLTGDPSTPVLQLINIPELHLLIGIVSKMLKELEKLWPSKIQGRAWMDTYLKQQALVRASYHGQQHLEGNKSLMFLKRLDCLEKELSKLDKEILAESEKFVKAFRSFFEVVKGCFGQEVLQSFKNDLKTFKHDYLALGISITPKVHILIEHVETFLDMKASFSGVRKGLGFYSEQSVESIHSDWKYFWEKYKVPDEHPKYLDQLKLAVIAYNAKHL